MKVFFASHPEQQVEDWCDHCLEEMPHLVGIVVSHRGIEPAFKCPGCEHVTAEDDANPLNEINDKLDKLMRHLGL